ncbi:MAG: hypothetical protein WBP12_05045 [Candidatus Saccharimonas sp.]
MPPIPPNTPPNLPTPPPPPETPQSPLSGPATPGTTTKSNKNLVIGIIVGGGILALVLVGGLLFVLVFIVQPTLKKQAEKQSATQSKTANSDTSLSAKKADTTCLALSDYANSYPIFAKVGVDLYQDNEVDIIFFLADSTEYEYPGVVEDKFTAAANFIKQNASKRFTIHLKGSVNGNNGQAGGGALSTQRAEKVRDALVARGADASKIIIDPPAVYDQGENPNEFYQSAFRNVGIIVHDDCLADTQ